MWGAINSGPPPAGATNCAISVCTDQRVLCVHVIWSEFARVLRIPCAFRRAWVVTGKICDHRQRSQKTLFCVTPVAIFTIFPTTGSSVSNFGFRTRGQAKMEELLRLGTNQTAHLVFRAPKRHRTDEIQGICDHRPSDFFIVSRYMELMTHPHIYIYIYI